jgi:hypothetical protein
VEITEGALSGDSSSCVHALPLLRAAGFGIADEFEKWLIRVRTGRVSDTRATRR